MGISGPQVNDTVMFEAGSVQTINFPLVIDDDDVALEDPEVFTLTLSSISDSRVAIGDAVEFFAETVIIIIDPPGKDGKKHIKCT